MHYCEVCGNQAAVEVTERSKRYRTRTFLYCEYHYREYVATSNEQHSVRMVNGYQDVRASSGRRRFMPPLNGESK
jgi:hypothetical protein